MKHIIKRILSVILTVVMVVGMIPIISLPANAAQNIVINGIDIGYANGDYFTKDGTSCSNNYWSSGRCHHNDVCVSATHTQCNCMRYWPSYSNCQVDLLASQCLGFARYCQWRTYGVYYGPNGANSDKYTDLTGAISKSNCTASNLKSKLRYCAPGTHVRTDDSGYHSVVIVFATDYGVNLAEANYDGYCKIRVRDLSWEDFASYMRSYNGIEYAASYSAATTNPPDIDPTPTPDYHECGNCVSVNKGGSVTNVSSVLNVRSGPGTSYEKVFELTNGTGLIITVECNGWYYITDNGGNSGWVSSDYVEINSQDIHTHSYGWYYELHHPHREYMKCDCGDYYYTNENYYDKNYTTGYDSEHPHRYYKYCTICGTYDYSAGGTQAVAGCTGCGSPEIPVISISKTTWDENETIIFSWQVCKNADYYFPMAYDSSGNRVAVCWGTPDNSFSMNVTAGNYYLQVASVNDATGETIYGSQVAIQVNDTNYPQMPVLSMEKTTWNENETVSFSWNNCINADCYYPMVYDSSGNRVAVCWGTSETTFTVDLSAGTYTAQVGSVNLATGAVEYCVGVSFTVKAVKYTIKFNANGGTGAPSNQTKRYGQNLTLSSTKPARTGYTFKGWSTTSTGSVEYAPGATYTANKAITLYAVWQANTYTVKFDANGGTWTHGNQIKTHNVNLKIIDEWPTRDNYKFMGWSTTRNGEIAYYGGSTYSANADVTLYAVWSKIPTYTVSYDANGGTGAPTNQTKTKDVALTLSSTKPTRTGYTFKGWATSSTGSVAYAAGAKYTANIAVTLYAVWQANTYTVKYNANGGTGSMSNSTHTYDTAKALTANAFTRNGYTFLGWATSSSATTATYTDKQSVKNLTTNGDTVTLYAVWKSNSVEMPTIKTKDLIGGKQIIIACYGATIYFTRDGSTPSTSSDSGENSVYLFTSSTQTIKAFAVRNGYQDSALVTKTVNVDKTATPTGTEVSEKLSLFCSTNGATIYYTTDGTIPTTDSINYSTGIDISDVTTVKAIAVLNGNSNSDVYTWSKESYTISYNANGGTGAPSAQSKTHGQALTLSNIKPTRTGYTFKGWSTTTDGIVEYVPGDEYTVNTDLSLYAVWQQELIHDVSGDGTVDYNDIRKMIECIALRDVDGIDITTADFDNDGKITMLDLNKFIEYIKLFI